MSSQPFPSWWETFAAEYLTNGQNATAAYLKAKPHVKHTTAMCGSHKLLNNPRFKDFLASRQDDISRRCDMTLEKWLKMLTEIAGFDIRSLLELEPETGDVRLAKNWQTRPDGHALESVSIRTTTLESGAVVQRVDLKRDNKLKAAEMLGKALGYLKDKVEVDGSCVIEVIDPYAENKGSS